MRLQQGDVVRTEAGEMGKVVHISRLTVFVALPEPGKEDAIRAFLESQLTKIAPSELDAFDESPPADHPE